MNVLGQTQDYYYLDIPNIGLHALQTDEVNKYREQKIPGKGFYLSASFYQCLVFAESIS